jgi:hypothetical protein
VLDAGIECSKELQGIDFSMGNIVLERAMLVLVMGRENPDLN